MDSAPKSVSVEIEDITCALVDTNFIFFCSTRHLTRRFLRFSEDFRTDFSKISEDSPKVVRRPDKRLRTFSKNVRR